MAEGRAALWQLHLGPDYPGFKVFAYVAGTTTEQTIWSDSDKADAITQPYVTGADGWATFYGDGDYRLVIQDRDGITIKTLDPIRITDDVATVWEGSHGTTAPAATNANKWHLFTKHNPKGQFQGLSISDGARYRSIGVGVEIFDVTDFGAVGDGIVDDTTPIQDAIDAAVPVQGRVYFPDGVYRTTLPVGPKTEAFGLHLFGNSLFSAKINGDHIAGPVVTFNRSNSGMSDITVQSTASRTSGPVSNNHGIYMEPEDISGKFVSSMHFERVRVLNQPGSGFVQVGPGQQLKFDHCLSQFNKGHGYVFDTGTLSGRTNEEAIGLTQLNTCWSLKNSGHGVVIGNPNDTTLLGNTRFTFINFELADNAQTVGTRFNANDSWIRAENVTFMNCAVGTAVTGFNMGNLYFLGRNLHIINHRSVTLPWTLELDTDSITTRTRGIRIDGLRILNTLQDPVIKVNDLTNVYDITVDTYGVTGNMTRMFTPGTIRSSWNKMTSPVQIARKTSTQSVVSSTTLVDATDLSIPLFISESVYFEATLRYVGNSTGDFKVGFTAPSGTNIRWQEQSSIRIGTGDVVTISNSDISETGTRIYGAASATRVASIVGRVTVGSTPGDFKVQFAQGTLNATAVQMLEGSTLRIYRENANI